jgi:hypothetical protein
MDKYTRWYNQITDRARNRIMEDYTETHHIKPRSLGGTDDIHNLVKLTAREHFICHWLLTKMTTGKDRAKMIYALNGMKRSNKFAQRYETLITSRVYENLKKEFSIVHSATMSGRRANNKGKPMSEEQKAKIRATKAANPYKWEAETLANRAAIQTGVKRSQETKDRIRAALKGKPKGPMSEEEKLKRSAALIGKSKKKGHGDRISATVAAQKAAGTHYTQQPKQTCPHCGKQASKARYNGYHGDRCKLNQLNKISLSM